MMKCDEMIEKRKWLKKWKYFYERGLVFELTKKNGSKLVKRHHFNSSQNKTKILQSFFLGRGDMATEENGKITQKLSIPLLQ